jgi:NAD(P)-dependent dehydrogenase (short-subunit alcohol dehydrogenase family)
VPALRASGGGTILVTSSLGGLIGIESDPVYSMTKHAVIGLVRSLPTLVAPYNIRVHALCPGFADPPLIGEFADVFRSSGYPLLEPDEVAAGAMAALASEDSGDAWVVQPGREPLQYKFAGVPGPRIEGYRGGGPPTLVG